MTTIAVLGAGVMASALTNPARDNGHEVRLIGTLPMLAGVGLFIYGWKKGKEEARS